MKKLFVFSLAFVCSLGAFAQHHTQGTKGFDLGLGITKHGMYFDVNYDMSMSSKVFLKTGIIMELGEVSTVNYQTYLLDVGAYYGAFNVGHKLYVNPGAGISTKLDAVEISEGNPQNTIDYGGFVGLELEYYFSDSFGMLIDGKQMYYLAGKFDNYAYFIGTGVKINF